MDSWLGNSTLMTNATNSSDCHLSATAAMHSTWVFHIFKECVTNVRQYFAFFIGISSIVFWLCAQAPQLVTNCRFGKADKALSFWFLLAWFAGDTTNLVGAFLTHQLFTQTATAVYFVIIDTAMMGQFLYYVIRNQGVRGLGNCVRCRGGGTTVLVLLPGLLFTLFWSVSPRLAWEAGHAHSTHLPGRTLLAHTHSSAPLLDFKDTEQLVGYVLGCVSAILYICSRLPQIIKNFVRCSVDGLSLPMFVLAVLGNVTYSLGIFLYSVHPNFLMPALPWIVGSVGTLLFDGTVSSLNLCEPRGSHSYWYKIFVQFVVMRCCGCNRDSRPASSVDEEEETEEEDERRPLLNSVSGRYDGQWCHPSLKGSIQAKQTHE